MGDFDICGSGLNPSSLGRGGGGVKATKSNAQANNKQKVEVILGTIISFLVLH